jgi:DivIVA domain-containing protein
MRVRAETVERHDFPVRRQGYDRPEVDAAMKRVAASLRSHEEDVQRLESDLSRALKAGKVFEESIVVIQETRERILKEASEESQRMKSEAEEALSGARSEADHLLEGARDRVDKLLAELRVDAEAAIAEAGAEAEQRLSKAEAKEQRMLDSARAESDRLIDEARKEAAARRSEAETEAQNLVAEARAEHERLVVRVPQLRTAVADIENRIRAFSSAAAEDLEVVDAMIEIADSESGGGVVSLVGANPHGEDDAEGPTNERPTDLELVPSSNGESKAAAPADDKPILAGVAAPDGSGAPPAARPVLEEGAEPRLNGFQAGEHEVPSPEPADEDEAPREAAQDEGSPLTRLRATHHVASREPDEQAETIYQRRGDGLRRRLDAGQKKTEE